jgi:hypothetical protein
MVKTARALFLAICLTGLLPQVMLSQGTAVVWQVPGDIAPDDKMAILAIAGAAGIREPRAVSVPIPSPCQFVQVESSPVLLGDRVLSEILGIRQKNGPGCPPVTAHRGLQQRGNWVAFLSDSNPRRQQRWRIRDGDWHVDIGLIGDVPYEDAVLIVQAIRRQQLIDQRPPSQSSSPIQYIDAGKIMPIRSGLARPSIPREYEITGGEGAGRSGGGQFLLVTIHDGRVELQGQGCWIA